MVTRRDDVFTHDESNPSAVPDLTTNFDDGGISDFVVQYWNGSSWTTIPNGNVAGNTKLWRRFTFPVVATNSVRITVNNASNYRPRNNYARIVEVEAWANVAAPTMTNVAAAANGATAVGSTTYSGNNNFPPLNAINGTRTGESWNDDTYNAYPDSLQVNFAGPRSITEIDVLTKGDDGDTTPLSEASPSTQHGILDFTVQYLNGSSWALVPNGSVTGNNKVQRKFTFPAITTSSIRVVVTNALEAYTRITEVEAWAPTVAAPAATYAASYVYADQINTPRAIIQTQDNSLVWRWDKTDPFGAVPPDQTPSNQSPPVVYNPRFPGQLFDQETGTHYNYFRNYDPGIAKYVQGDPLGLTGGIDTYQYAAGNPLSKTDPTGQIAWAGTYDSKSLIEGIGAGYETFDLTSECFEGKKATVQIKLIGPGAGFGVPRIPVIATESRGSIQFHDNLTNIQPSVFNGLGVDLGGGVQIGALGYSANRVRLGNAFSVGSGSNQIGGITLGGTLIFGSATVVGTQWQQCSCPTN